LNGFFVQEEDTDTDADPATSEGIFIFDPATLTAVNVGDNVTVTGTVTNFGSPSGLTELITLVSVVVNSAGNPLPAASVVSLPSPTSPAADLERFEGMRVMFNQTLFVTGNDTLLILNRVGGDLGAGAARLTSLFGVFYDDLETGMSFTFNPGVCQFRSSISNNFSRITPRFETLVPAGRSGWLKLFSASDHAILGAAINFNPNAAASEGAFNQGHNLHKLSLTSSASFTIPIFQPNC
jgi:hypothetical protein